jgi:hypothetical protein
MLVAAAVMWAPALSAQEAFEAQHRSECQQAARALASTAGPQDAAAGRIHRCESSGPPALARAWSRAAVAPESLGTLVALSVRVRDQRLYRAVTEIALDGKQPEIKRAAALSLLGRWASPGFALDYEQFFAPGFRSLDENGYRSTSLSHDNQFSGSEPLPGNVRAMVASVAQRVAASEASFRLRAVAEVLASRLGM